MNLKLCLKTYIKEFKRIVHKLAYWVWNKFWGEDPKLRDKNYIMTDINYKLWDESLDYITRKYENDHKGNKLKVDATQVDNFLISAR